MGHLLLQESFWHPGRPARHHLFLHKSYLGSLGSSGCISCQTFGKHQNHGLHTPAFLDLPGTYRYSQLVRTRRHSPCLARFHSIYGRSASLGILGRSGTAPGANSCDGSRQRRQDSKSESWSVHHWCVDPSSAILGCLLSRWIVEGHIRSWLISHIRKPSGSR